MSILPTVPYRRLQTRFNFFRYAVLFVAALLSFSVHAAGDFTKIANNGTELAANAKLGNGATDWACTRDNATGLVWEVKTADGGLRDHKHTYAWFNTDPDIVGGSAGFYGTDTCGGTLAAYKNRCNTASYVAAVNAAALCGHTDWRMPRPEELRPLVDFGTSGEQAAIDPAWFPNSPEPFYWTDRALVGIYLDTWYVNALDEKRQCGNSGKEAAYSVRLVRVGKNKSK